MSTPDLDTVALSSLLARARAGDEEARDDLIRRSQVRLEAIARKMLRGYPAVARWEDTGDILQTSLIRLIKALKAVNPASTRDFFGLAAEQMRRVLIDMTRHYRGPLGLGRNYQSGIFPGRGEGAAVPDAVDAGANDANDLDRWAALHEAIGALPIAEREAFMLSFYHGWTQPRIAELFGVDERTIRRRLRSATSLLNDALGGELPGTG